MKKSEIFERFFVKSIAERVDASGLSHAEFARRAFESPSGPRIWRATREQKRKRALSLGEAYMMAEALGKDFPALLWEIQQEADKKDILT